MIFWQDLNCVNRGISMEDRFIEAIRTYFAIVENACDLLINFIERTEKITLLNKYGLYNYFNRSHKFQFDIDDKKYCRHGNGMMVLHEDTVVVDWNFGYKSWWCGIDPFLMATTLEGASFENAEYYDGKLIKEKCEQYVQDDFLYFCSGQYYINMLKFECVKVEFPSKFDRIVVEYKGNKRSFSRNKSIDKFIRESNMIYSGIKNLKDNYIIIFYYNDEEVARILYNDIAYPDLAVEIMNEEIIKPYLFELWNDKK